VSILVRQLTGFRDVQVETVLLGEALMELKVINDALVAMFAELVKLYVLGVGCPPKIKQCKLVWMNDAPARSSCQHTLDQ
jgi:hypothetical protein